MFEAPRQMQSAAIRRTGNVPVEFTPLADVDLQRLWSIIWRGKTTILLTTAAALLLAVLFVLVVPHRYTAVTQILIDPTDLKAVNNDLTQLAQANDAAVLQVESQVRVMTSDSVLRRVVREEMLDHDPEFVGQFFGYGADSSVAALNGLRRSLTVKRTERTFVVDVTVTSREPAKAARIANAIAQAYLNDQTDVRSDAARQVSQTLTARLNELKDRVREAEDRAEAFKARNNIVSTNGQLVNEQQLTELNNQLGVARARTAAAKARLDQVQQAQMSKDEVGAFPEAVQSQTITALRSQYAEIMRREAEQLTSLGERHPAVIEIEAQAARLRRMIEDEVRRIALSARAEYESARGNEEALAANLEKLKSNAITTNEALVTLRELERDVLTNRAIYEAFLVRARETGEQERLDTKNIRVISRAEMPLYRSFPPSNMLLALGAMLLGVIAGTGLVFVRESYAGELPRLDGAYNWGGKVFKAVREFWPAAAVSSSSIPVLAVLPQVDVSFGLEAAENTKSHFAMELRKVHEAVRASHKTRDNPSILVVACDDADDTVAVALTLAAVAAATQRVLLIDADLERRTLSAIDADRNDAGLIDVASGRRVLSDVIVRDQETNINLVSFVSPGSRRDRPLAEADVKQAFDQTKRFDMVIVAAVDLNHNPSTNFFAGLVDHIVLVARANDQNMGAVDQFIKRLGLDAQKIRGAVLTAAKTT
ncbi:MAG TPA: exopolysaccharide transport family protein [Xanthobacteraceae bacterium]|nr:exopolysaccharide transport family protein [Xanthobacteraceae bacterium]